MPEPTPLPSSDRLSPGQVAAVLRLAGDAERTDGVRPVNEATELRLRATSADVVHLVVQDDAEPTSLAGYAQVSGAGSSRPEVELVVHPDRRRRGLGSALLRAAEAQAGEARLQGWAHGDLPAARGLAESAGYEAVRGLWRMRLDVDGADLPDPTVPTDVTIRGFRPGADEEAWLTVNARAFAAHPEQGRWTAEDLAARTAEPWFEPAGLLLAEDAADGRLLGFHWTKVEDGAGEVYVVGVDPSAQGRRLGSVLTLAGLHHLRDRGVATVDLFVESDNAPALAVYRRLGFRRVAVDVMYRQRDV